MKKLLFLASIALFVLNANGSALAALGGKHSDACP
jgi:hypothetical protein